MADNEPVMTGSEPGSDLSDDRSEGEDMAAGRRTWEHREFRPMANTSGTASTSNTDATSAGSQTGVGQADVGTSYREAGSEAISDIGQAEAYLVNMKRVVADELDHDQFGRWTDHRLMRNGEDGDQQHRDQATRAIEQSLVLQAKVNDQYLTHIANLNAETIAERERTVRHGDIAANNMWQGDVTFDSLVEATVAATLAKLGKSTA